MIISTCRRPSLCEISEMNLAVEIRDAAEGGTLVLCRTGDDALAVGQRLGIEGRPWADVDGHLEIRVAAPPKAVAKLLDAKDMDDAEAGVDAAHETMAEFEKRHS